MKRNFLTSFNALGKIVMSSVFLLFINGCSSLEEEAATQKTNFKSKKSVEETSISFEELLLERYHLRKIDFDLKENPITLDGIEFDWERAVAYQNDDVVITLSKNEIEHFAVKGKFVGNDFVPDKIIHLENNLDSNGNGTMKVHNLTDDVFFESVFVNGEIQGGIGNNQPNPVTHSFCQREKGETFGQCFSREVAEFCSDFVGAVAYATHAKEISLLIATMCTC